MVDIAFKVRRVLAWRRVLGLWNAVWFEIRKTFRPRLISIRVPGLRQPILVRAQESDLAVFRDVVIGGELDFDLGFAPDLVVDCGANTGVTAAVFANRFPQARIIGIEPADRNQALFRRNLAAYRNVSLIEAAVWSRPTHLKIENPDDAAWAFRCVPAPADDPDAFPAVSVGQVLDEAGAARNVLVKIDIEGAETELFRNRPEWLDRVQAVLIELHGPEAEAIVSAAFDPGVWSVGSSGEKRYFRRKSG